MESRRGTQSTGIDALLLGRGAAVDNNADSSGGRHRRTRADVHGIQGRPKYLDSNTHARRWTPVDTAST